ncbi:acyl-CoA dehydrogenase family protein [Marinobacter sp. ANT_B65]|uniref:acyl-CoA dehydrogenase family protein n=1 Tax=Marinobacter sp. ANT_B65 TaxID=2039467 RepID=UPI0015CDDB31|nr:acyl-CoA dehydrogenase family protein [Marinobacter sp. ANT_B65]
MGFDMEETDQLIRDTAHRLFTDQCDAETVNGSECGEAPARLQKAVLEAGLTLAWVPEVAGGVGGSLALGFNLIRQAAGFALPVPLADTLVASLLQAESGLAITGGWAALAMDGGDLPVLAQGEINGVVEAATGVPEAEILVMPVTEGGLIRIAVFAPSDVDVQHYESLAGEARSRVTLNSAVPDQLSEPVEGMTADGLVQFCALVRACQIAGALEKMGELTVGYVKERQQFGRPLGKFQAVQHKVADIAGESAITGAAVEQAIRMMSSHPAPFSGSMDILLPVATAKVVASEAAGKVPRDAHQAHGAMGFSFEYPLHQYSRRVWSWREEFGSEFYWSERLGMAVASEIDTHGSGKAATRAWDVVSR